MGCAGSKSDSGGGGDAAAANGTPGKTAESGALAPVVDDNGVELKLTDEQKKRVSDLFKSFDVDDSNKLPLSNFKDASLKVGPHEAGILKKLADMDYDKDGFVTREEWEHYFTASAALSIDEFNLIVDEMTSAGDHVCTIIRCTRLAADAGPAPPIDELEAKSTLSPERAAAVEALYHAWDVNGQGFIDRKKLTDTDTDLGPHKVQIMSQMEAMDADGDNLVTKSEMIAFFQAAVALSDDEFNSTVADMMSAATQQNMIANLTQLAAQGSAPPTEDLEATPPLSEARTELLKTLWGKLSGSLDTPVKLEDMKKAEKGSTIGPHSVSVLKEMYAMDLNSDGMLEWSELLTYFQKVSPSLSDDEYAHIIEDMTTRIDMQLLAEMVS